MNLEVIYQFATTASDIDAYEIMQAYIVYMLGLYEYEMQRFIDDSGIDIEIMFNDEESKESYYLYLAGILWGLRERTQKKIEMYRNNKLTEEEMSMLIRRYVMNDFKAIEDTETMNVTQMAQLNVVSNIQGKTPFAKVYKTWIAIPGCCETCAALNGTKIPIDQPFLVNGQVVELEDGREVMYNYITRYVAIAHPNDRCYIEFSIEY